MVERPPRKRIVGPSLSDLRLHLARADAIVTLSVLAVLCGLATGALVVVFRLVTERTLVWAGVLPGVDGFEALGWEWRLGLPTVGGLLIGLLFQLVPAASRQVGPVHVIAQLARHGGRLPGLNAVMQFFGGAASIVAGHSVGREGPAIHLGAACASLLGQWIRLPNNSIRTLVACGVAAAIAASFNTPLAGVVFAMEVVMFEYTLAGFAPVILAAVSAASLSQLVFGSGPVIPVDGFQLVSLLELPWVVLLGVVIGCLAAAYVSGICQVDRRSRHLPPWLRMTIAGALTGLCALAVPEVMGLGYDTVQSAMLGRIGLLALVAIVVAKLAATIACGGLGLPGGLIGPMVVIGAAAGGALGIVGHSLVPGASVAPAFYATLGAVAMMGACLHAPLAALTAILELTSNPNVIMPGMVAVVTAFLTCRVVFRQEPIFLAILHSRGMDFRFDPVALALERTGVAAVMSRSHVLIDAASSAQVVTRILAHRPQWVVMAEGGEFRAVLTLDAFKAWATAADIAPAATDVAGTSDGSATLALGMPAEVPPFATVPLHATLGEVLAQLDRMGADVALVTAGAGAKRHEILGVISRAQIESGRHYAS